MTHSFKGTDKTTVTFTAKQISLANALLEQASFSGVSTENGAALDDIFSNANAGDVEMSHDQLALMNELLGKAAFTREARKTAAALIVTCRDALHSFYPEPE